MRGNEFETSCDDYGYEARAARYARNASPHEERYGEDAPTLTELRAEEAGAR